MLGRVFSRPKLGTAVIDRECYCLAFTRLRSYVSSEVLLVVFFVRYIYD